MLPSASVRTPVKSLPSVFTPTLLLVAAASCASHRDFAGPVPVRNQHPAQLGALHLDPIGADAPEEGEARLRVDAAYTSLWLVAGQGNASAQRGIRLDGELLRVGYKARIGLTDRLELGAELPIAYAAGGWLDDFVIDYHDLFSFPDQGRSTAARDRFQVDATRGGQTVYSMKPGAVELLDLPLSLVWHVAPVDREHPFGLAVRGGLEVPLGDTHRGYGNGRLDAALGLVGEARLGAVSLTAFAQHAFVGTPLRARAAGVGYGDVDAIGLGVEALLGDGVSALVQGELESSVLGNVDLRQASHAQGTVFVGARFSLGGTTALELGVVEDVTRRTSPDFTGYAAIAFGRTPRR